MPAPRTEPSSGGNNRPHWIGVGLLFFAAFISLVIAWLPYSTAKPIGDTFARDGSLELLTPPVWQAFRGILAVIGLLFGGSAVMAWRFPVAFQAALRWFVQTLVKAVQNLPRDAKHALTDFLVPFRQRQIWLSVLVLFGVAVGIRIFFVNVPMEHDEAYTFSVFAVQPLRLGLSDYHYPNNHLFHTLLVHISYQLLGIQPWTVRLPALLAGALLAPFGYGLARRLYSPGCGLAGRTDDRVSPCANQFFGQCAGIYLAGIIHPVECRSGDQPASSGKRLSLASAGSFWSAGALYRTGIFVFVSHAVLLALPDLGER